MKSIALDPESVRDLPSEHSHQGRFVTTTVIDTAAGFHDLRQEWSELLLRCTTGCLFLTWEWLYTWWTHLADNRELHIITARHEKRLVAIMPLAYRPSQPLRLLPFRVLEFLGSGNVGSDYLNMLVLDGFEDDAIRAIAGCLTERNMVLQLSQVDRMTPQMINIALQLRQLGWHPHRTTISFCPYINLVGKDWQSYLGSLGTAHRANFRRRLKKLSSEFRMNLVRAVTEEQRAQALNILVTLHTKRWRTRGGSDALHRDELIAFHDELTQTALGNDWLRLYVLWLDGVPVAALYGFVYDEVFYFYQSGFDDDYSQHSVGLVMMGLVIKDVIEAGLHEFDFLHGEESYKYLWAREERELVRFDLFPPHTAGSLYSQLMQMRHRLKRRLGQWRKK